MRVSTMPIAGLPALMRSLTKAEEIADAVVSVSSIMSGSLRRRERKERCGGSEWLRGVRSSGSPPGPAVARQHRGGGLRAPVAGGVLLGAAALALPVVEDGVEDPPGLLDLLVVREQRWVAEEDVEDQAFVRLRAGLDERAAVGEVHVDVADLQGGAGHLRPEPQGGALVWLDPDHQRVVGELLGGLRGERLVRRRLEDDRH